MVGSGRIALAHMAWTLPGVSMPSSVVRSMHRTARSSAASFDEVLIDRVPSAAARATRPTSSTAATVTVVPVPALPVGSGPAPGISMRAMRRR